MRGSISITVTATPKRANIDANSMPTAPAPITIRLFGISLSCRISSEVSSCLPSGAMPGRLSGREPVAIRTFLVSTFVSPASPLTTTAFAALEPALALEERDLVLLEEVALDALAEARHDAVLAAHRGGEVDPTLSATIPYSLRFWRSS